MTGATLGKDASPFSGTKGGPPKTGQFFLAIDPGVSSGGDYATRITALVDAIRCQEGARLPGDGRAAARARAARGGVAVASATLAIPSMILGETALSFLGLGLRAPAVSWGLMLNDALDLTVVEIYPWLLMPLVPVIMVVLAFSFLGDGLRDALDPRTEGR